MRDMELQKELDALKDAPFAKKTDAQLRAIENRSENYKGRKLTDEHRKNIGIASKKALMSEETRKKISDAGIGRRFSSKTRKKMSGARKNIKLSLTIARKIRKEYFDMVDKNGKHGLLPVLAKKYKVTKATVSHIVNNQTWKEEY